MVKKVKKRVSAAKPKKVVKAKKVVAKVVKKKALSVSKPFGKTQLVATMVERVEMPRKQATEVLAVLEEVIKGHVTAKGPGVFTLPGILKIMVQHKPATKARKGINPFTGEPTIFKAKPARRVVKIRPLKKLKEMV